MLGGLLVFQASLIAILSYSFRITHALLLHLAGAVPLHSLLLLYYLVLIFFNDSTYKFCFLRDFSLNYWAMAELFPGCTHSTSRFFLLEHISYSTQCLFTCLFS